VTRALTAALAALLFVSLLLAWVPERWAVSLLETGMFALAAAWVARWIARGGFLWSAPMIPLAAAVLWAAAQLATGATIYARNTEDALLAWGTYLAAFTVARNVFADPQRRDSFLRATLAFGFAVSIVATLSIFTSPEKVFWLFPAPSRNIVAGPFLSPNQYAAFIELLLPVALAGAAAEGRRALPCAVMAGAMYASVVACASRAGFILTSAELVACLALAVHARSMSPRRMVRALGVVALFAALFTTVVGWDVLLARLERADPWVGRREMLASTIDMIRARPWTGHGLGTWATAYPAFAYYDDGLFANTAHNDWAQWTAEGGIPFALLLIAMAAWAVRPAIRSRWGIGVLAVFLHCLVDYPLQKPALAALVFVLLGALASFMRSCPQNDS